ncbi:Sec-independent protein translocase subunit TatA [Streptomyces sp. NPDC051243]|uniref:Sec-independent protein translocase subunit TatA n=1 Tax=Streptomyces sp. NPDC051243 TaxID=3365646 RepID=UPI0037A9C7A4
MFGRLGAPEIILILVVIILLFGAKKLPDMARSLGKSARILKSEAKAMKEDGKSAAPADPPNNTNGDDQQPPAQRIIQAAPGDVTSSRPVNEPTDTTKR